ncbi:hypothetical protein JCM11641_008160 [Rhodosporidiobolus odoratus]
MSTVVPSFPSTSFVPFPYATPSISPQQLKPVQAADCSAEMVVLPPIEVSGAPPSPASTAPQVSALALFAAEMFVWLWFAPCGEGESGAQGGEASRVGKLQIKPTNRFLHFCNDVLTTTQVSHSVVVLALLFISRLKQRNAINGSPGSEYRLAVTGLMLANKVLDDNTYTAQTWSQISALELKPLVAGEAEFLQGLDWSLHITKRDFDSWVRLLEGHVAARNVRLGKASSASTSSRKIASSKRVRTALAASGSRAMGSNAGGAKSLQVPTQEDASSGRSVRRRVDGSASTNTTPTSSFATFTLPAPPSDPHPHSYPSAPLPSYGAQPHSASSAYFPHADVSPTSLAHTARRNAAARAASASSASGQNGAKRRVDDAFGGDFAPFALPPLFQSNGNMGRSYSAGPTASAGSIASTLPPSFFVHPSHQIPNFPLPLGTTSSPLGSRPSSSSSAASSYFPAFASSSLPAFQPHPPGHARGQAAFDTLSDAFSPHYDPAQRRRLDSGGLSLQYYSLAAGHGLGHLHQTLPPPPPSSAAALPSAYALGQPSGLSTVSHSPAGEAYAHSYPQLPPYPTPNLPSSGTFAAMGSAPMGLSMSSHGGSSAACGVTRSSPPRMYSPPNSAGSGATYPASALPQHLLPPPLPMSMPHLRLTPQQAAAAGMMGPHPYFSSYSNAGVPGVYYRGSGDGMGSGYAQ